MKWKFVFLPPLVSLGAALGLAALLAPSPGGWFDLGPVFYLAALLLWAYATVFWLIGSGLINIINYLGHIGRPNVSGWVEYSLWAVYLLLSIGAFLSLVPGHQYFMAKQLDPSEFEYLITTERIVSVNALLGSILFALRWMIRYNRVQSSKADGDRFTAYQGGSPTNLTRN